MKNDFERQTQEMSASAMPPKNGDFTKQGGDILNSPDVPKNGDFTKAQEASIKAVENREGNIQQPVQERKDYETAVDEKSGSVSTADAPTDPSIQARQAQQQTPTAQQPTQQAPTGNMATPQQPTGNTPANQPVSETAPAPQLKEAMLTPASEFEAKRQGFFNPDTEKGFFDTLDKKMQEALRGSTPEEIAQNMTFAAITMIFDMIANACDNDRKEFKRLKDEYLKRVAENDGPDGAGVGQSHKNLMFWSVIAAHPSMQQYLGQPITKETKKAAEDLIRRDKEVQNAFKSIVCSACGREVKAFEFNTYIEKALKVKTGNNTLGDIQNRGLNDEVVQRGVNLSGTKGNLTNLHQRWARHAEEVRAHNARRADARGRRNHRENTQTFQNQNNNSR